MQSRTLRFSESVRVLADAARRRGMTVPAFRSPPQDANRDRTIRHRPGGDATVAVRLADRPFAAVQADIIDGIIAVNGMTGIDAEQARRDLWAALLRTGQVPE